MFSRKSNNGIYTAEHGIYYRQKDINCRLLVESRAYDLLHIYTSMSKYVGTESENP